MGSVTTPALTTTVGLGPAADVIRELVRDAAEPLAGTAEDSATRRRLATMQGDLAVGDRDADALLITDPFALLLGMLIDRHMR